MHSRIIKLTILTIATLALQAFVSPLLKISGTTINYCLASVVAISIVLNDKNQTAVAVILGLFMDLTQSGPFGAYTLLFLISSMTVMFLTTSINSSNITEKAIIGFLVCAIINLLHCLIVGIATPNLTIVLAFTSGQLWSCLFDGLVSIVLLMIVSCIFRNDTHNAWISRY